MEIELKLALDARHSPSLRKHPLLAGIQPQRRKLHSVYLDTPDFQLMGRGLAFRLRRVGFHWVQTLKAEARAVGALSSRPEWEMAVAGSGPDFAILPKEAQALLEGIDRGAIGPVFITEFQRTTWQVQYGEASVELALDRGEIIAGESNHPISEVEIELLSGPSMALFDLALVLLERVPLRVEPRSKAERGYHLSGAASPAPVKAIDPHIRSGLPAGEAWVRVARTALAQLVANQPGFLEHPEEIEYLHQVRVALRRLRAVVGLGRPLGLDRPPWAAHLADLMCALNPARDWDVFLHETLPTVQDLLGDVPIGEVLLSHARASAGSARHAARAALNGDAFTRLVLEVGRDLLVAPSSDLSAAVWSADILDGRWKKLRRKAENLAVLEPEQRHAARIAAKKLRYAAEALMGLHGKRGACFLKRLANLQNDLGRYNDAYVATRLLEDLWGRNVDLAFDAGRISGVLRAKAAGHGRESDKVWARLARARVFWR